VKCRWNGHYPRRGRRGLRVEKATYSVSRMSDLLGVSRSGYYAWAARLDNPPGVRADLTVKIKVAHDASNGGERGTQDPGRPAGCR
jgi:hypothetical protein